MKHLFPSWCYKSRINLTSLSSPHKFTAKGGEVKTCEVLGLITTKGKTS